MPSTLPVILVAGFLGAGKTTLMRRLIADGHARDLKLCVVVNEFGAMDVDGHILREADAELLLSIEGGCACCSGQDDFRDMITEIALRPQTEKPDVILVEASGLADPGLLLEILSAPELLSRVSVSKIICVADAARAPEYSRHDFALSTVVKSQLRLADLILLNKANLADAETLDALQDQFQNLNSHAEIQRAVECEFDTASLWPGVLPASEVRRSKTKDQRPNHAAHTIFCPLPHPVERARLEKAFAGLPPQVWRAKGFVRVRGEPGVLLAQFTGGENKTSGRFRLAPFHLPFGEDEPPTGLVFIGAALDEKELLQAFLGNDNFLAVI
jgi:G3E family GTPase